MEGWLGMYASSWRVKNFRFRRCGRSRRGGGRLATVLSRPVGNHRNASPPKKLMLGQSGRSNTSQVDGEFPISTSAAEL